MQNRRKKNEVDEKSEGDGEGKTPPKKKTKSMVDVIAGAINLKTGNLEGNCD
jgi:hypothetical protein